MLEENRVAFTYREYTEDPLSVAEIRNVLLALGLKAKDVLRKRDRAYREQGLTGDESESQLVQFMAAQPTLLQRPIGVLEDRAVVGRPPERLLELL